MLDDAAGNILSKYDPGARRGLTLAIKTNYVTTSPSNCRNVHFGIDNGRIDAGWTDAGRPGNAVNVFALTVHGGQLYAATCDPGKDGAGHVYRYAGGTDWIDCGSPDRSNAISPLAAYQGKLYAGSAWYNMAGSSLPPSPNDTPGGRVFRFEGGKRWVDCGRLAGIGSVYGLAVYGGKLYASSRYKPAAVFRYEGGRDWVSCGTPDGRRVTTLNVFNGRLYGLSLDGGFVFRYEGGTEWSTIGKLPDTTQTYGFATYEGNMYVSTWPTATVFRYDGDDNWANCGRLGKELEVMGMAVYNGKLYAGTLPLAEVYRYDGGRTWTRTGQLDTTPNVRYRRAWSMAVFQGKLFSGTLPSGHVYSIEAGKSVTHDYELGPGWRHLAAVRSGGSLKLYLDGKQVAASGSFNPGDYDLSNDRPLRIGFGDHDYFNGSLSDVRLYNRALTPEELTK